MPKPPSSTSPMPSSSRQSAEQQDMTPVLQRIWCDEDEHYRYEHFADFNEWLDSEEGQEARVDYGIDALPQPSKALFSGDRNS